MNQAIHDVCYTLYLHFDRAVPIHGPTESQYRVWEFVWEFDMGRHIALVPMHFHPN